MTLKEQYENRKKKTLSDKTICLENRNWMKKVLEYQETKGKRSNGLPSLDNSCYKTLLLYIHYLTTTNKFFKNKPIKRGSITEQDFKQVYEGLEEGKEGFTKSNGKIYEDKTSFYNKIFKSKPFEMVGLDKMAKKIIQYNVKKDKDVRFIQEFNESLKELVQRAISQPHKVLIQILGDYGENIFTILQNKKKDFERVIDKETGEVNYLLNLHKGILKRSRTPRREYNIFPETRIMLDKYLEGLKPEDKLFNFGLRQSEIMFKRAVEKSGVKLQNGETPTLKDLRSSLACYLLNKNWTTDEIRGRLGHKPSSKVLDCYVSYLALDKNKTRKKIQQGTIEELKTELETYKEKSKRDSEKIEDNQKQMKEIQKQALTFQEEFNKFQMDLKKEMKKEFESKKKINTAMEVFDIV